MKRIYVFLGLFALVYYLEAIGMAYIISAIQNIEKQFQIPSKISGSLVSASDFGYIPTVVFISYFGGRANRARWMGAGSILISVAYFVMASPNFFFPVKVPHPNLTRIKMDLVPTALMMSSNATLESLLSYSLIRDRIPSALRDRILQQESADDVTNFTLAGADSRNDSFFSYYSIDGWLLEKVYNEIEPVLAGGPPDQLLSSLKQYVHRRNKQTDGDLKRIRQSASAPFSYCGPLVNNLRKISNELKCTQEGNNFGPFIIMFTSLFFLGIGRTMPWSLGVPLLDDNIKKRNLPAYFGLISFIRILGPISGHLMGSFTNKLYYTLHSPDGLTPSDPSWIGAWWLGFLVIGTITLLPSCALFFFPSGKGSKIDPENKPNVIEFVDKHKEAMKEHGLEGNAKSFYISLRKLLSTKIYRGAVIGRVCDVLAFKGYVVFLPKYLENHFGIPLFKVHQYMAIFGVFGFALGTGLGGLVTNKMKFNGRSAALFALFVSALNVATFLAKSFIACESVVNSIGANNKFEQYNLTRTCNSECGCDSAKLYPVCDRTGHTFYSPCHAGCREVMIAKDSSHRVEFLSCECADGGRTTKEFCVDNCRIPTVLFFAAILAGAFFAGLGMVPSMLILLRSVPPATRSIALGLQGFVISLFGTMPSPVLWGFLVDSACLMWEKSCDGQTGHCSIYEPSVLRWRMHIAYVVIRGMSLIMDIYVWYHAGELNILDEEPTENVQETSPDILQKGSVPLEPMSSSG